MKHTEKAYAKINLYLNVTAKREDAFHDIESVMQTINLHDTLHFDISPSDETKIRLSFTGPCDLPTDERNLAVRAAKAFLSCLEECYEVHILLEKSIPMAAGLAGGSADAAATLRALDTLLPGRLSKPALLSLAAELGSDVPFCLLGGRALCYGRGEETVALPNKQALTGLLVNTAETSSTPKAYGRLDQIYANFDKSQTLPADLSALGALGAVLQGELPPLYNIFEDAVLPLCPLAASAKDALLKMGADAAMMSGSGPSVFALTQSEELLMKMEQAMKREGFLAVRFSFI